MTLLYPSTLVRLCRKGGKVKNVMLEPCAELVSVLFQHLIESNTYETLK